VSRRRALSGVATVGLSLPLLSACGDDESGTAASDAPSTSTSAPPSPSASTASDPGAPPGATTSSAPVDGVVGTADVPVGGGVVLADEEVVVTQPAPGEFRVFTAVCTHEQCLVSDVSVTINCVCHKSKYDIATGEPTSGPAPSALDPIDFEIADNQVVLT
jgi:Rieske Fe-S protein